MDRYQDDCKNNSGSSGQPGSVLSENLENKLQSEADISNFLKLPEAQGGEIIEKLPWNQRDIIGDVFMDALMGMNIPTDEVENLVGKVKDKKVSELFASMEKMDI